MQEKKITRRGMLRYSAAAAAVGTAGTATGLVAATAPLAPCTSPYVQVNRVDFLMYSAVGPAGPPTVFYLKSVR